MIQYQLRLTIDYLFDRPASAGRQLMRILPKDGIAAQRLISSQVRIMPEASETERFVDFYGTEALELVMAAGASHLTLTLDAALERRAIAAPDRDRAPRVADLPALCDQIRDLGSASPWHFRAPSRLVPQVSPITDFAREATLGAESTLDALEGLGLAIHRHMIFDAKATAVDTAPLTAFQQGRGVCQDFAQIMVGGLRALGVPAAYVAGYLRTIPPEGQPRLVGADAMHAWVRAWLGPELGWVDYDPTNATFVGLDHIEVGMGRDYAEVAPVTGFLRLEGMQTGRHSVDIEARHPEGASASEAEVAA